LIVWTVPDRHDGRMHPLFALPKAELHLHIEGTLEPEMVLELARRNRLPLPFPDVETLRRAYRFDDLSSFLDLYYACGDVLRTEQDFSDLVLAYLRTASGQGVRHAEMFFDPQAHTSRGIPLDVVMNGLRDGARAGTSELGVSSAFIACFLRDRPVTDALATLEALEPYRDSLLGVGLDSAEVGYPPALFAEVFEVARSWGLHTVAHAGEEGPPEYVWQAVDVLGVERIDHGVRVLEDPALVARLSRDRIPLTVCPFSNVRLRVIPELAAHPLPAMLAAGLAVTVNSDDPAYFGGYVGDNFAGLSAELGLTVAEAGVLAKNSFQAAFLDDGARAGLLASVDDWLAEPAPNHP
jgi:adenosine deaminase